MWFSDGSHEDMTGVTVTWCHFQYWSAQKGLVCFVKLTKQNLSSTQCYLCNHRGFIYTKNPLPARTAEPTSAQTTPCHSAGKISRAPRCLHRGVSLNLILLAPKQPPARLGTDLLTFPQQKFHGDSISLAT